MEPSQPNSEPNVSPEETRETTLNEQPKRKSNIVGAAVIGLALVLVVLVVDVIVLSFLPSSNKPVDQSVLRFTSDECVAQNGQIVADPLEYGSCMSENGCSSVMTKGLISDMANSSVCQVQPGISDGDNVVTVGGPWPLHQTWETWGPCPGPNGSCWQRAILYNTGRYEMVNYQGTTTYELGTEVILKYEQLVEETGLRTKPCDGNMVLDYARSDTLYVREESITFPGCEEELNKVDELFTKAIENASVQFPQKTGCVINPYEKDVALDERMYLQEDIRGGASCIFAINSNLPLYRFDIKADEVRNEVVSIDVYLVHSNDEQQMTFVQKLEINPNIIDAFSIYKSQPIMTVEDVNFDGYSDIVMPSQMGGTGGALFYFWVYDPESDRFVFDEELAMLPNPVFDADKKEVRTVGHGGLCYTSEGWFKYLDGKLTLVRTQQTSCVDDELGHDLECVAKELIDDKMATTTCIFTGGG